MPPPRPGLDTASEDLRKYGFTLVSGLLTAGGLVRSATSRDAAPDILPPAAAVVMVLARATAGRPAGGAP